MKNEKTISNVFFGSWNRKSTVHGVTYSVSAGLLFLILHELQAYNYLLFHSIAEMISAFCSFMIFIIVLSVWRNLENNNYICFLGIAFFFNGVIDLLHMLAYEGMPIFKGFTQDLTVQLWVLARYLQAVSLLIASMLIKKNYQINKYSLFLAYSMFVSIALLMIFVWKTFPVCFIEGQGLTPFKIISEYIICGILIISMLLIVKQRQYFNKKVVGLLVFSIVFQIFSELEFTTYMNLYAFSNFVGHYFKIIAVVLFCRAIIIIAMDSPSELLFAKLKKRQYQLKEAQRIGNMGSWELNIINGDFTWSNQTILILEADNKVMDFSYEVFLGMIHPEDAPQREMNFITAIEQRQPYNSIHRLVVASGASKVVHERGELSYDGNGNPRKINCIIKDITEQRRSEEEILRLNVDLEKIVIERTIQLEEMNCELEATNATLEEEISERQNIELRIQKLNDELEDKVKERTSQLDELNAVLDESNTLLSAILDSSPEIIVFSLDTNYCYLTFNTRHQENMLAIWGKKIEIGMNFLDIIGDQEDVYKAIQNFERVLAGESFTLIEEYGDQQDQRFFFKNYWSPILSKEGKIFGITCFVMDITEIKLLDERLEKYQILAEKANDVMMFLDNDGNIIEVNDAAIRMYGYTFEEFLKMTIYDLRNVEKTSEIMAQMKLAHEAGVIFETTHYRKDGTKIQVEVSSQGNILGKTEGLLSIIRDVTERKRAQEEMIIALQQAEEANLAKSQFLANMSHEIRTPMNGIIGMTELTLMTDLEEVQREYLNIVKSSTRSLLRVVNDILDYSKIEAGKIDLEKMPFDLQQTMNEVIDLFDIGAKQKGLSITGNIDMKIPNHIIGDSVRLRQILSNLVGNAIKFTEQGGVTIDVHIEENYYNKVKLRFVITDTGIGIPEDKLEKLFKRFSQVDESNTRRFGGTGLGLAISKKLIEIMDGEIGVESKENIGSSFFFTAVFGLYDDFEMVPKEIAYRQPLQYKNIGAKKLLLAEDDVVSRNMLTIILKREGFKVTAVENGAEAVAAFEKEKFDVILMDVNMPYLDGYSATATIRLQEKDRNSRTPIIAITAYALKGDREKCLKADMDDYISKPINFSEIIELIQKHVRVSDTKIHVSEGSNVFLKTVDELMEASGFDRETSMSILNDFCRQALRLLGNIKKNLGEKRVEEARVLVHQLKGSAGNIRAKEIAKHALGMEEAIKMLDYKLIASLLEEIEERVQDLMQHGEEG